VQGGHQVPDYTDTYNTQSECRALLQTTDDQWAYGERGWAHQYVSPTAHQGFASLLARWAVTDVWGYRGVFLTSCWEPSWRRKRNRIGRPFSTCS